MIISIKSKRNPPPHRGTFNHRLRHAGALLAVFTVSLLLIACPSPGGGGGTSSSNGGGNAVPDGGKPTPPAPEPEKPTPEPPTPPPKPKAWHVTTFAGGVMTDIISPYGIAQSGDTLYVIDQARHSLRTVHTTTARVGAIVPGGGVAGGYVDGAGTSARFNFPRGIAAADAGTLYVADSANHRIREVSIGAAAAATQVSTLSGSGTPDYADDATGTNAMFNRPAGLAVSGDTLYVADQNNHRIRAIDLASANKTVSTIAGSSTPGHADGAGAAARFNTPTGLAVSGDTLYVADYNNHRIRAIDITSGTVRDIAGDGTAENTNGIGIAARFNNPTGIAVSGSTLYVTTNGGLIRKLEYREVGS